MALQELLNLPIPEAIEGLEGRHRSIWNLHEKIVPESFKRPITKEQSKDTGMAMVLLLLLASGAFKREILVTVAIIGLVVDMTLPQLYRPVAVFCGWVSPTCWAQCSPKSF
jgi:hypothetical protein